MRERDNNFFMDFEDTGFGGSAMEQNEALANMIQPPAPAKTDYTQALKQQILAQGRSDKWTGQGHGSAEANAEDMAKILAGIGITDINQFGKFTETGLNESVYPDGKGGFVDLRGKPVDPKLVQANEFQGESGSFTDYSAPVGTQEVFGNKVTKQAVPNTYSERQTGNFFGGTFEGKGNTGYGVQFDSQGNPIFYTQGASSNDLVNLFKDNPLLGAIAQVGAAYFGGPAGSAALAAAMGKSPEDILKSTALSYAGNLAGGAVSGMEGITDVLGETGTQIAANAAKQYVGSGGDIDPVQALLSSGLNAGINTVATDLGMGDLTPAQQKMVSSGISGLIAGQTPEQIAMNVAMAAATAKPDSTLKSSLGPGNEQDFIDNLIPGYFQPGGAGYAEPAALPSPDEDFMPTYPAEEIPELVMKGERPMPSPDEDFMPTYPEENIPELVMTGERPKEEVTVQQEPANLEEFLKLLEPYKAPSEDIPELVMTGNKDKTQEHVFDPTFGGALPPDNLPYLPTDDDFVPTDEIEVPETPTTPVATPKVPTPTKAPTTRAPTTPAASSGMDMMGLLALLGGQQQPVQQAPMQDPYAHIKLMEDLFGSTIDLTPAGENTAQRK